MYKQKIAIPCFKKWHVYPNKVRNDADDHDDDGLLPFDAGRLESFNCSGIRFLFVLGVSMPVNSLRQTGHAPRGDLALRRCSKRRSSLNISVFIMQL